MKTAFYLKTVTGALIGVLSVLFGNLDVYFYGLVFCIVADYITGICAAVYEKKLDSRTGFVGILKKIVILTVVALAHTLGEVASVPTIRNVVIGFYIANEGLSILENAARMNIKGTKKLKEFLKQLSEETE